VEFCHKHNLIHGDIKPENVLLTRPPPSASPGAPLYTSPGCIYKLADFGLSQQLPEGSPSLLLPGPVGTPVYMAPEARRGELSLASDMWSVGVLM
jgi:protein-serine/threonine kinase